MQLYLNYSMERCWSISALNNSNKVAFGYDLGTVMVSLGQEEPAASMDRSGKVTFARGN
jgi:coatomer subunit beta'